MHNSFSTNILIKTRIKMKKITLILSFFVGFATNLSAQWQPTAGIYGGNVFCSVASNENIFIGTRNGVYLSTDNGAHWTFASNGLPSAKVTILAVSGANIFAVVEYKGVYLSTNNGQTWTVANTGLGDLNIISLAVGAGKVYAGSGSGLYITTNNGGQWDKRADISPTYVSAITASGSNVFVSKSDGVLISSDSGNNWTFKKITTANNDFVRVLSSNGNRIVAGTSSSVFLSTDNGQNWANIGLSQPPQALAIRGNTIFAGTIGGVNITSDNGASWQSPADGLTRLSINTITLIGSNDIMVGTSGGAFFSSINDNLWIKRNDGITEDDVSSLATDGSEVFATTWLGEVYGIPANQNTWTPKARVSSSIPYLDALTVKSPFIWASSASEFFVSNNNGNSWAAINSINQVSCLANSGGILFAGTYGGLYKSANNGTSWTNVSNLLGFRIEKLTIIDNKIYVVASNNANYRVHLSTDNGDSWTTIYTATNSNTVYAVTAVNSNVFISISQGILLLKNNGGLWTSSNTGLMNQSTFDVAVKDNVLYAATYSGGIFLSENLGTTWKSVNEGLPTKYANKLIVAGRYLYAATNRGVFRRLLGELAVGTKDIQEKIQATISPNPVSNQLTVNVSNALIGKKYTVINALGETMKGGVLTDNSTVLSVNDLVSGIYFLHFIGTSETIKFFKK